MEVLAAARFLTECVNNMEVAAEEAPKISEKPKHMLSVEWEEALAAASSMMTMISWEADLVVAWEVSPASNQVPSAVWEEEEWANLYLNRQLL